MSPCVFLGDSDDPGGGGGYTNMPTISPSSPPLQASPPNTDSRMVSSRVLPKNLLVEIESVLLLFILRDLQKSYFVHIFHCEFPSTLGVIKLTGMWGRGWAPPGLL